MAIDPNYGINIFQEFLSGLSFWTPYTGIPDHSNDPPAEGTWILSFPTQYVQDQLDYLWNQGIRNVRISSPDWNRGGFNFGANKIEWYFLLAEMAADKGFHIEMGILQDNAANPSYWASYLTIVPTYALRFQTVLSTYGVTGVYTLGNEQEANANLLREKFTSVTRASNVVTIVHPLPHSLATGDSIVFYATETTNGGSVIGISGNTFVSSVTVDNATTFHFTNAGTDATSTDGYFSYGAKAVRNLMKRLATSLRSGGLTVPFSYSCFQGYESASLPAVPESSSNRYYIDAYSLEGGRGDIDYIDVNTYGDVLDQEVRLRKFIEQVRRGVVNYGVDHFRVTEFNIWADETGIQTRSPNIVMIS